jgi:hypothetical protein
MIDYIFFIHSNPQKTSEIKANKKVREKVRN